MNTSKISLLFAALLLAVSAPAQNNTQQNTGSGTGGRPSTTTSSSGSGRSGSRPSSNQNQQNTTGSGNTSVQTGTYNVSTQAKSGQTTWQPLNKKDDSSAASSQQNQQNGTGSRPSTTSNQQDQNKATGQRPSGRNRGSRSESKKRESTYDGKGYGTASRQGGGTPVTVKSINDVLKENAKYDSKIALTTPPSSEANLPAYVKNGDKVFILVKEEHDIMEQNSDIFAANYENIYPGAIIYANQGLANGDPTLVGLPEGKVTLRVDFMTGNKSSKKTDVINNAGEIQDAIFDILSNAKKTPATKAMYSNKYSSSAEELAVGLNVSANFLSNSAKIKTNISKSEMHVYEVENFTQEYYTVSITQESDKSKYFAPSVTGPELEKIIWQSRGDGWDDYCPLAIITSVTYGRRAYKVYDYSSSSFKFSGSESASIYGQKLASTQDIVQNSETKNIWLYMDGADSESAGQILTGSRIDSALENKLGFNPNTSPGVPLYYTVRFLASGNTVDVMATGKYTTLSYQELPTNISVTLRNEASGLAGSALKMRIDYAVFRFDEDGNRVGVPRDKGALEGYNRYIEKKIDYGRKKTFDLKLKDGEFLDGPLYLQVRCKFSAAENYHEDLSGEISPDRNGTIDIKVDGNIRWGPAGEDAYITSDSYTKINNSQHD